MKRRNSITIHYSLFTVHCRFVIACLILVAVSAILYTPTFIKGFPSGHDASLHYRWAVQFNEALKEPGVFYPRWLPEANEHQGSPAMLYYPPLSFFAIAFFNLFVGDTLRAMTIACFLALALSGVAMYIFSRSFFSLRLSLLASGVYLFAPYHLYDFYHRAALGEFWAFVWLPLILDAIQRIIAGRSWRAVVYLGVSYAALLLTHVPLSFAFSLVLPIYILIVTRDKKVLLHMAAGFLLGACLSAVFVLPVLFERSYVRIQRMQGFPYTKYWVFEQIFQSPLFQLPDQRRLFVMKMVDLSALALPLLLVLSAIIWWLTRKRKAALSLRDRGLLAAWLIGALCLLLTTELTAPIWKTMQPLDYLQFPYRWLTIVSFLASLLLADAFFRLTQIHKARSTLTVALILILILMGGADILVIKEATYDRTEIIKEVGAPEAREYYTIWQANPHRADEEEKLNAQAPAAPAVTVTSGDASIQAVDDAGISQSYLVKANQDAVLQFRTFYFPGWRATVDGKISEITASQGGNIELTIPSGEHQVNLQFGDTRPRRAGKILSAIALLLSIALLIIREKKRRTPALTHFAEETHNEAP